MRRFAVHFIIALFTFSCGVLVSRISPIQLVPAEPSEPLRVTLAPTRLPPSAKVLFDHYLVTIENVSSKTVHGYSLGHTCRCRGFGTYGPYPEGISYSNPSPQRQKLAAGASHTQVLYADNVPTDQFKVWVDLVHFTDGTNWGPNQSRTEGYVRGLE
jgi:hypothetical protein